MNELVPFNLYIITRSSVRFVKSNVIEPILLLFICLKMDSLLMDGSDSNGNGHQSHSNTNGSINVKLSPNSLFDRDALATLLLGNQSPTSTGALSSVDEWADSAGELLVELDNLSMLSQICDSVPRLPPKPHALHRSTDDAKP